MWGYSKLRKAYLINLLRSHDANALKFTEGAQEESDNKVDPSDDPKIMEQFDPEESDNEVDPSDDPKITEQFGPERIG